MKAHEQVLPSIVDVRDWIYLDGGEGFDRVEAFVRDHLALVTRDVEVRSAMGRVVLYLVQVARGEVEMDPEFAAEVREELLDGGGR